MEQNAGHERIAESVAERDKVARVRGCGRRVGLDLDRDDRSAPQLGGDIDLKSSLLLAYVKQAWSGTGDDHLRPSEGAEDEPDDRAGP